MGTVLDTTVFVDLERQARATLRADVGVLLAERLAQAVGEDEEVAIATITASELLHGVHRASLSTGVAGRRLSRRSCRSSLRFRSTLSLRACMHACGRSLRPPGAMSARTIVLSRRQR